MINDYINISAIETHLDKVIRKSVSKSCYAGRLPSTLTEGTMEYVVIDCAAAIHDLHAYGKGIVNIYLYAQPINGLKNVATMSKLEKAFSKALKNDAFDSEHYSVAREVAYTRQDYDSSYNMDFTIKAIQIIIK